MSQQFVSSAVGKTWLFRWQGKRPRVQALPQIRQLSTVLFKLKVWPIFCSYCIQLGFVDCILIFKKILVDLFILGVYCRSQNEASQLTVYTDFYEIKIVDLDLDLFIQLGGKIRLHNENQLHWLPGRDLKVKGCWVVQSITLLLCYVNSLRSLYKPKRKSC